MQVHEIMTAKVDWVKPDASLTEAAKKMQADGVGILPVGENDRLIGMLTDRDMVLNAIARDKNPQTCTVREAMREQVLYVFDDQPIEDAAKSMADNKVRRMPVLNRDKRLVGIVSLGDIASHGGQKSAAEALREISKAA